MDLISKYIDIFREEKEKCVRLQEFECATVFRDMERHLTIINNISKFLIFVKSQYYYKDVHEYIDTLEKLYRKSKLKKIEKLYKKTLLYNI